MPQIYLYAELLIHIRQLTLHASLQNEKNNDTKILLSFDKKVITVLHKGESASLYLPTQISGKANITFPTKKETDLSARLVIEDESELVKAIDGREEGINVPWCAKDLGETVVVECKNCANVLVEAGKVKEWKDLPSENWADLMDLWFCHKPHEVGVEDAAASKGISAESKPSVAPGVGLVDVMSLLLHKEDCKGVKVSHLSSNSGLSILPGEKKEALYSRRRELNWSGL
jgi:ubiquitin-protein ligase E3 D